MYMKRAPAVVKGTNAQSRAITIQTTTTSKKISTPYLVLQLSPLKYFGQGSSSSFTLQLCKVSSVLTHPELLLQDFYMHSNECV